MSATDEGLGVLKMEALLRWEALLLFLAAGAGYLLRRVIEGKPAAEKIERKLQLVNLKRAMDEAKVSTDQLDEIEDAIFGRRKRIRKAEDAAALQIGGGSDDLGETQLEMNLRMQDRAERAEGELERVEADLLRLLEQEEREMQRSSSEAWRVFVEKQASVAASVVAGGSMAPLFYAAELERLTIARIADLRDQISIRQDLFGS